MRIHIIAVGSRMPVWVEDGYREYAKRFRGQIRLQLHEVPPGRRTKGVEVQRVLRDEGTRLLAAVPAGCRVVALDRKGRPFDTHQLCAELTSRLSQAADLAILIGGPEGLDSECYKRAEQIWSLSLLTIAHPLVRVVLAEQLYRVWSIINGLPYHRR